MPGVRALILIHKSACESCQSKAPRKRRGAHAPSRAVSGASAGNFLRPPFTVAPECLRRGRQRRHARARVLPNASHIPAVTARRLAPAIRFPKDVYKDQVRAGGFARLRPTGKSRRHTRPMDRRAGGARPGWDNDPRSPRALALFPGPPQGSGRCAASPWASMGPRLQRETDPWRKPPDFPFQSPPVSGDWKPRMWRSWR